MDAISLTNVKDTAKTNAEPQPDTSQTTAQTTEPSQAQTIEQWLAKQPADHSIIVYLERQSLEILELRSEPRHHLHKVLQFTNSQAAQYKTITPHCLLRTGFDLATHWAATVDCKEDLAYLQSARLYLSRQTADLDCLITHVYEGVSVKPLQNRSSPLAPAALMALVRDATERSAIKDTGQLLAALLKQRLALSQEMALLDTAVLQQIGHLHV
jgi:hypothetical protein